MSIQSRHLPQCGQRPGRELHGLLRRRLYGHIHRRAEHAYDRHVGCVPGGVRRSIANPVAGCNPCAVEGHSHSHSLTFTLTHTHTYSLTLILTHTHSLTHTYTHSHSHSLTHTHSLTLTLTHSHTHTLSHSLTHTHTHHPQAPVIAPSKVPSFSSVPTVQTCSVGTPAYLGDGWCDKEGGYNTAECNWDGGDCCESTCEANPYECGTSNGYDCKDPSTTSGSPVTAPAAAPVAAPAAAPTVALSSPPVNPPTPEHSATPTATVPDGCDVPNDHYLGDGWCDKTEWGGNYNTEACGFDGGDCCESTCQGNFCGRFGYECNTALPTVKPTVAPSFNCDVADTTWLGDGWCDKDLWGGDYNTEACGFDGGDCCASTCQGQDCGRFGYDCKDPSSRRKVFLRGGK
jgi:hypothetical protein